MRGLVVCTNIVIVITCRRLSCVGHAARVEEARSDFKLLTGKPIVKKPLGRPRCR